MALTCYLMLVAILLPTLAESSRSQLGDVVVRRLVERFEELEKEDSMSWKKKQTTNDDGNNTPGDVLVQLPACNAQYQAIISHTICKPPSPLLVSASSKVDDAQKPMIVNLHNTLRSQPYPKNTALFGSAMQAMVWDDNIAIVAQNLANTCIFAHDSDRSVTGYGYGIGQNLAMGYGNWESAIRDGWFGEVKDFVYGEQSTGVVGHYTAMVKEDSARVGCGFALCKSNDQPDSGTWTYYVCNYAKIQADTKKPFQVGAPCGQCSATCKAGLCDCKGKICENGGEIDLNTCQCKCPSLWNGSPRCTKVSCPSADKDTCPQFQQSDCNTYANIPVECPYMCGICKKP